METLRITRENVDQYRNTKLEFNGHIEIAAELGIVAFLSLKSSSYIVAEAGSGI